MQLEVSFFFHVWSGALSASKLSDDILSMQSAV